MFRLAASRGSREGAYCGPEGLYVGCAALIERQDARYRIRADDQIVELLTVAYGAAPDCARIINGLPNIAGALQEKDLPMATIGALHLCLEEISEEGITRIARTEELLKNNFNPDEPRDWHGRWTTEGDAELAVPEEGSSVQRPGKPGSNRSPKSLRPVRGVASYYNLVGHRMANGQMFDARAMHAAMLGVPLGTAVTVRLVEDNSRSITVIVTDRGPYAAPEG